MHIAIIILFGQVARNLVYTLDLHERCVIQSHVFL